MTEDSTHNTEAKEKEEEPESSTEQKGDKTAKVLLLSTGPGCATCARVKTMLDEMGVKYEEIDVTQKPEMLQKYPFYVSPGLVIDGEFFSSGVPDKEELEKKLKQSSNK